jgi:RNA polymerase sigma-70 factor (ECF subfamily)
MQTTASDPSVRAPVAPAADPEEPYRPGDVVDFERLYRASFSRIRATLVAMLRDQADADDCAQEAFVRAFRAWPQWRPEAPAEAWVHRIAINVAVSHRRRTRLSGVLHDLLHSSDSDPSSTVPERSDLMRALQALPPRQAAAIVLRHLHGYSNREIAAALDVPERTVASRLTAARGRLAQAVRREAADEK